MRILVIEDDRTTGDYIVNGLREEGHVVDLSRNGREGLLTAQTSDFDVLVVDRMLPDLDGLSLVRTLRAAKNLTPALFLTALGGVDDRIEGLNAGGDDYLVKPFAFGELSARLAALARRPQMRDDESTLAAGDLQMDLIRRKVTRDGVEIDLCRVNFRCWNACFVEGSGTDPDHATGGRVGTQLRSADQCG